MVIFGGILLLFLGLQFVAQGYKGTFDLGAILLAIYILITMVK